MSDMKGYYRTLLKTGDDSDFRIITKNEKNEDVERKVHKLVLKQCPYFKSLFAMDGREVAEGVVRIVDIRSSTLDCLMKFIYYEAIEIETVDQILEVISATEYFQMDIMKCACVKEFRRKFKLMTLSEKLEIIDRICLSPPLFEERVLNDFWYTILIEEENWTCTENLSANFFRELIVRCGQSMPQRSYRQLVRWINTAIEERMPLAKELKSHINFNGFTLRGLIDISCDALFEPEAILELLKSKKNEEVAKSILPPEERRFNIVVTHNTVHEFEYCGLQWLFACQIFNVKRNDDIVFKLKSGGHLAKHFKIRIALLNYLNQVVLEWTSNAVLYHGSIPNPEMLEPAKHDGVFTFQISLVAISDEAQQLAAPTASAKVPPTTQVASAAAPKLPPAPPKQAAAPKGQAKRRPLQGPKQNMAMHNGLRTDHVPAIPVPPVRNAQAKTSNGAQQYSTQHQMM